MFQGPFSQFVAPMGPVTLQQKVSFNSILSLCDHAFMTTIFEIAFNPLYTGGFSVWFQTINLEWSIVHIKEPQFESLKLRCISALEDCFNIC